MNPEDGGTIRSFSALPPDVLENRVLKELLKLDYSLLPFQKIWKNFRRNPIEVGIHFIRMSASNGVPGISTPNLAHRDGEFFTFIHLVNRQGVTGGDSLIYKSIKSKEVLIRGPLLYNHTMKSPLDTLIVWDRNVFHDITPVVVAPGNSSGLRDVILIDFSPLESVKVNSYGKPSIQSASFTF